MTRTIYCGSCGGSGFRAGCDWQDIECFDCSGEGMWEVEDTDEETISENLFGTKTLGDPFGPGSHPSDGAELHRLRSPSFDPYRKKDAA